MSQIGCHGLTALDFYLDLGHDYINYDIIQWSGNLLVLIFTDNPSVIAGNVGIPVGTSDHCYVSDVIENEISCFRKIYLKSQADWDGILIDLHKHDWVNIYRQVDHITSMNDTFKRVIVRYIPS